MQNMSNSDTSFEKFPVVITFVNLIIFELDSLLKSFYVSCTIVLTLKAGVFKFSMIESENENSISC
jgi:hypothetical protein